jgi:hypothetical protein
LIQNGTFAPNPAKPVLSNDADTGEDTARRLRLTVFFALQFKQANDDADPGMTMPPIGTIVS